MFSSNKLINQDDGKLSHAPKVYIRVYTDGLSKILQFDQEPPTSECKSFDYEDKSKKCSQNHNIES